MKITLQQIEKLKKEEYIYLDIRGDISYAHGHIPDSILWDGIMQDVEKLPRNKKLIVYCTYGEKSIDAAKKLEEEGYDAYSLEGGYRSWLLLNYDGLSPKEQERYDRQMILPQVGIEGQKKLKNSSVLIVGAGGLGAPAALYLAGAGIGTIGIMDADEVSISNLQRQVIHSMSTVHVNKAESAKETMEKLNDQIEVKTYPYHLTPDNAQEIISQYDFIIDAVDNFEAKFLINDTCVLLEKPFCHGGILQFEGQVMTYVPQKDAPCYRCIFEEIPESGSIPNCSQAGVIGAIAGIIGSIQALEAIKYILNIGELLTGKMLIFHGLTMKMRVANFGEKNPGCRVCGEHANIKDIKKNAIEYMPKGCMVK